MLRKYYLGTIAMLGLVSIGCQTPYGRGGYAGGCCGGSPAASANGAAYAAAPQTYAPATQGYAPAPQPTLPPAFHGGGSGSR